MGVQRQPTANTGNGKGNKTQQQLPTSGRKSNPKEVKETDNNTRLNKTKEKKVTKMPTKKQQEDETTNQDQFDKNYQKHQKNEEEIWTEGQDKQPPSAVWLKIPARDRKEAKPYVLEDLFKEGESVHDLCRLVHIKIPLPKEQKHTIKQWIGLFQMAFQANFITMQDKHAKKLRTLSMRMAVTNPRAIFDGAVWKGPKLLSQDITQAWVAATTLFGDIWKEDKQFDIAKETEGMAIDDEIESHAIEEEGNKNDSRKKEATKKTNREKKTQENEEEDDDEESDQGKKPAAVSPEKKAVGFAVAKKPANSFFLVKTLRKKKDRTDLENTTYARKNKAYATVRLPKITKEGDADGEKEAVELFNAMAKRFFHSDKRAVILTWNDSKTVKPLIENSTLPKVRAQMEQYVDRVFIEYNKAAYCRMRLAFDIEDERFFGDEWFKSRGYWMAKDKLQVRIICNIGWLMGSAAIQEANGKDLGEALRQVPLVNDKSLPVDIRMHGIKLEQQEKIPRKDQVRAANVYGDYNKAATTRQIIRKFYKDGKKDGFPLGQKMRFIPNIADARYPVTAGTRANIRVLRSKQKSFIKNIRTHKSNTIQGLDYYIEEYEVTLRQVIMGIRTSTDQDKAVFISVEDAGGTSAVFTFHKNNADEARQLVTSLPIVLEMKYGARIWTWFTEDAKAETSGWFYDEELQKIVSPDEQYTKELLEDSDWDDDSIEEQDEDEPVQRFTFDNKIILNEPAKSNHYGDNGSVKTYDNPFDKKKAKAKDDNSMVGTVATMNSTTTPSSVSAGTQDMSKMTDAVLQAMQEGNEAVKQKLILALQESASQSKDSRVGVDG
jgi:hypothetical protein